MYSIMNSGIINKLLTEMLPDELVNNISQYLDDSDFVSLRNTCKKHRSIAYYPKRQIQTGVRNSLICNLRLNRCIFSILFLGMTFISVMFLILSIVLLCIGYDQEHLIIGTTLLVLSTILLFLDCLFVIIFTKIAIEKKPVISNV